ncbi:MAG TPA: hypothetical protein P5181_11030 [Dermatophilaceae bacterium]|nr:hypothetical protein [Dermatophilaceae bacterium]
MIAGDGQPTLDPGTAERRFLLLTVTRWLPVGLVVGMLELPTSGLADAFGRRPLLLLAGIVTIGTALLYLRADSFAGFALAAACLGIYRALDSGPLEAWFVDIVHATDPDADVSRSLSRQGTTLGCRSRSARWPVVRSWLGTPSAPTAPSPFPSPGMPPSACCISSSRRSS